MTQKHVAESEESVALRFLRAYWSGNLSGALECCTAAARMELPPSVPMQTPAPIAELLSLIFKNVYPRFVGSRFEVDIEKVVSDETTVFVEYIAHGQLVIGRSFRCRYVMMLSLAQGLSVDRGKVEFVRSYTDTRYVSDALLSA